MGPFAFKNIISEIQIRQGKWISVLGQITETGLSKDTAISQTSESELPKVTTISQTSESVSPKEETESMETTLEKETTIKKDYESEKPKISAMSQITLVFIAVLGVLLIMIFVIHLRSRASK